MGARSDPPSDNGPAVWTTSVSSLTPGQSARFRVRCAERTVDGFLVNHEGRFYAYVNRCAHVGTPLDLWPNEFCTEDGRYLICATHGALYRPDTGECVAGPCPGTSLTRLAVGLDGERVVVTCPGAEP